MDKPSLIKDDFLQLRLYKIQSSQIYEKTLNTQTTKRLLIPILLILLTISIFDSHSMNSKYISTQQLSMFYKETLNKGYYNLLLDALEDHSEHLYQVLCFVNNPDDKTFMRVIRDHLRMDMSWENSDTLEYHQRFTNFADPIDFTKESAGDKLNLPFSLVDLKNFGNFFSSILNMNIQISGIIFCIESSQSLTADCYESIISIKYINRNNVVISKIRSTLERGEIRELPPVTLNSPKIFTNILTSKVGGRLLDPISITTTTVFNMCAIINAGILLVVSVLLMIDGYLYYLLIHRKKMEKHFKMARLIYQEQYKIDFTKVDEYSKLFIVNFSFILGFTGNLCLFFFFLSKLIIGSVNDKVIIFFSKKNKHFSFF